VIVWYYALHSNTRKICFIGMFSMICWEINKDCYLGPPCIKMHDFLATTKLPISDSLPSHYLPVVTWHSSSFASVSRLARTRLYHVISGCGMPKTLHVKVISRPSSIATLLSLDNLSLIDGGTVNMIIHSSTRLCTTRQNFSPISRPKYITYAQNNQTFIAIFKQHSFLFVTRSL